MKKDAKIIGVWGGRGSGKSTRIKELVRSETRVIVIDPTGEYKRERGFTSYKTVKGMYRGIRDAWVSGFKVALDLSEIMDKESVVRQVSVDLLTMQKAYFEERDSRKIILVIDEMSLCVPNRTMKPTEREFLQLCNLGRHYGVEIIGASQRLAQVHTDFRGNTAENYYLRMMEHVDIQAAKRSIGEQAAKLPTLAPHNYLHFTTEGLKQGRNKANFQ